MNIFFKEIQKSFDLLDQKKAKQSSLMTAWEYMLKIAKKSEHETEICTININQEGNIVIVIASKKATLTIIANDSHISYTGTGPQKEDQICTINSEGYSVHNEVLEWIKRNCKQ